MGMTCGLSCNLRLKHFLANRFRGASMRRRNVYKSSWIHVSAGNVRNLDAWTWTAHYADGSALGEWDEQGNEHGFREVEVDRVVALELTHVADALPPLAVLVDGPGGQKPVFFRRRTVTLSADGQEKERETVTCIGWEGPEGKGSIGGGSDDTLWFNTHGRNAYLFTDDAGRIVLTDRSR